MNKFTYTAMNADIPVIYVGECVHIHVNCVTMYSVKRAI